MRALLPSWTFLHFVQFLSIQFVAFRSCLSQYWRRRTRMSPRARPSTRSRRPAAGLRLAAAEVVVDAAVPVVLAVVVARVLVLG